MFAQALQIDFIAQAGAEGSHQPPGLIFLAIEAAINHRLDAPPQRLEQRGNRSGGTQDGNAGCFGEDATQEIF